MPCIPRRTALQACIAACTLPLLPARAQQPDSLTVAQIVDESPTQHDVSRDFLVGSRAAWASLNATGGIRGQRVQHLVLPTDGSAGALHSAWQAAQADPRCVALSGCVGDAAAATLAGLQGASPTLAQIAPWLMRNWQSTQDCVFPIFASYQAQLTHAVRSLATMGVTQAGVAFASPELQQQLEDSLGHAARSAGLRLQAVRSQAPPPMLLFAGATLELHSFVNQLRLPRGRQCYVVALADVSLQVLTQLGKVPHGVSVIVTQPVPVLSASLAVVRDYRTTLARLYDEAPTPQGLAGFIAARHTAQLLASVQGPPSRASVLAACRERSPRSVGGFTVQYQGRMPSGAPVTQAMLLADGRIVG